MHAAKCSYGKGGKRHLKDIDKYNVFTANADSFLPRVRVLGLRIIEMKIRKAETFGLHDL